ncbi:RYL2, partial [Symbiodinium sp. CCMP2456]
VLESLPKVEEMPGRRLAKRVLLLDGRILLAEEVLGELDAAGTGSLRLQLIWQNRQVLRTDPGPFEEDGPRPLILHLAICGARCVGKTSLLQRYTNTEATHIGLDFKRVHLLVDGDVLVRLYLWDSGFNRMRRKDPAQGLFLFDLTDRSSFDQ